VEVARARNVAGTPSTLPKLYNVSGGGMFGTDFNITAGKWQCSRGRYNTRLRSGIHSAQAGFVASECINSARARHFLHFTVTLTNFYPSHPSRIEERTPGSVSRRSSHLNSSPSSNINFDDATPSSRGVLHGRCDVGAGSLRRVSD
jgi:hypothetical protein